jgi:hypothetical protein
LFLLFVLNSLLEADGFNQFICPSPAILLLTPLLEAEDFSQFIYPSPAIFLFFLVSGDWEEEELLLECLFL